MISLKPGGDKSQLSRERIELCPAGYGCEETENRGPSRLRKMKQEHEAWVNERLSPPKPQPRFGVQRQEPAALVELVTASDLVEVAMGVEESSLDNEDLENE